MWDKYLKLESIKYMIIMALLISYQVLMGGPYAVKTKSKKQIRLLALIFE